MFTIRLVHWLGWVFKNKERKKERKLVRGEGGRPKIVAAHDPSVSNSAWDNVPSWSKKSLSWEDCAGAWAQLSIDNVNFCTRSRPYQREASRLSGPDRVFFIMFWSASHPSLVPEIWVYLVFSKGLLLLLKSTINNLKSTINKYSQIKKIYTTPSDLPAVRSVTTLPNKTKQSNRLSPDLSLVDPVLGLD